MAEAVSGYAASYVLGATCEFWSFLTITLLKTILCQFSSKDRQEVPEVTTEGRVSVFFLKLLVHMNIFGATGCLEITGIYRAMTKNRNPNFNQSTRGTYRSNDQAIAPSSSSQTHVKAKINKISR